MPLITYKFKSKDIISMVSNTVLKSVNYQAHVEDIGWMNWKKSGETSGTTGESKRLEAINIKLEEKGIEYRSYIGDDGWDDYKKDGETSGTTGESKRLEAIQIRLYGELSENYNIYYRVHVQNLGWLGWAKNDEIAGTTGYNYRIEAIEIKLLNKDEELTSDKKSYYSNIIRYKSHIQDIGWMDYKNDSEISGTTGLSKRLEAFNIELINIKGIEYKSYAKQTEWEDYKKDGEMAGTTGEGKKIEAIQIQLYGDISEKYDIYYRVHVQNLGWLGWAKNGEYAGTNGYDYAIEAIEIKLLDKNDKMETETSYYSKRIGYSSHVSNIGWMDYKNDGKTSGKIGNNMEAIKINLENNKYQGNIEYKSLINGFGWEENYKRNGEISGTIGRSKPITAIQIKLSGEISEYYDVYYRVYIQNKGWLGWTKNGEMTGSNGFNYALEATEIILAKKDENHPTTENNVFLMTKDGYYNISIDDKYLDVSNVMKNSKIFLNEKNDFKNQIWKIKDYNDGTFRIFSSNPNLLMNNSITLSKYENKENEKFKIIDLGNGYYDIKTNADQNLNDILNVSSKFKLEKYEGIKTYRGIDISKWQGNINWEELIYENPDFIIMRIGTGRNNYEKDSKFDEYYSNAKQYDIPIGAYTYSYALNINDAKKEANLTLEWLNNKKLDLPIFYDIENINQTLLGKDVLTKIAETFCETIIDNGYKCGIYASKYFLIDNLNASKLSKYPIWLAHWTGANNYLEANEEKFKTDYNLTNYNYWQFSSLGVYRGITENTVDLDLGYDIFD